MNRLIKGSLVLVILAGMVLVAGSTAKGDVPDEWKSLDVAGLTALAQQFIAKGDDGVDDCKLLATYVAQRYATDAAADKVNWDEWFDLASLLGGYYPSATQEAMAKDMKQKLAPDQAAASKLTDDQLKKTCKTLVKLRQFGIGSAIFVTWSQETNAWQSWDAEDLGWLVYILGEARESGKPARLRLLVHISGKYLTDNTVIRSVPGESWKFFAEYLYGELTPDARTQWINKIRVAFADMDALKPREAAYHVWILRILGDTGVGTRTAKWMEGSAAWKSWGAWELDRLAEVLSDSGEAGKASRVSLAGHISTKYMVDKAAVKSVSCLLWRRLARFLRGDLSAEASAQWVSKLRAAYVDSPPGLDGLKGPEFKDLIWSLRVLGDTEVAIMVVNWMEKSTAWQSWGELELDRLVYVLSDSGEAGKAARVRLIEHISSKYLANADATRSLSCMAWKHFARWLGKDLPAKSRVQWAGKIKAAFADRIGEMDSREFQYLSQAMVYLDATQAAPMVVAWLSKDGKLALASTFDLAYISAAGRVDRTAMAPLMNQLETLWLARNSQKPLKLTETAPIVWTWIAMGDKKKAQQWTMRAYESIEQVGTSSDADSLARLGHMFLSSGLTGKGKGYPAFAAALARLAGEGKLVADHSRLWRYKFCAAPLGMPATQQTLKAALTDEQGNPRAMVANILAWTYRNTGELNTWREFLDQKVAATAGDGKALWLMAKAYTESLVPRKVDMRRSFRWLNAALAAAATQPVRLVVLTELVGCYGGRNRHKIALSILESVKNQYTGEERAKIDALEQRVRGRHVSRLKDMEAGKAAGELARKKARLAYYRKRLVAARAADDQDRVVKLEAAIQRLEATLE